MPHPVFQILMSCQIPTNLKDCDWFHHIVGISQCFSRSHLDKRVELPLVSIRNTVVPWVRGTELLGIGPCSLWLNVTTLCSHH